MANLQIKGIKVNGVGYELNLGDIVSHLTSPNGTDYILKVDDNGNLYAEGGSGGGSSVTPIDPPTGDAMTTARSIAEDWMLMSIAPITARITLSNCPT